LDSKIFLEKKQYSLHPLPISELWEDTERFYKGSPRLLQNWREEKKSKITRLKINSPDEKKQRNCSSILIHLLFMAVPNWRPYYFINQRKQAIWLLKSWVLD
jgi:hypothetical protein